MSAQELRGADGEPAGAPIRLVAFDAAFDRSVFDCGEQAVNDWFRRQAGQSHRSNNARTVLAVQGFAVVGFYASRVGTMERGEVAEAFGGGRGRYPMPAILLAQLGVDVRSQGRGLGARLLVHALESFLAVADKVGVEVILVDALTPELCAFYRKMGFRSLEDRHLRMFMPVKVLRATFNASS
ncbi:GNAT family N-acetyltransferase [Leifsonia shinshuensis]|uniref:GNAT superfamily N-acetyltransferase n=1 Tax=Leifsonia shinshuensis TaxID=150026 RepID=A0A853CST0_9MICO|nr:GNAT family N-acetyltransferase [Leifsonia shinshuensis]NYJ22973.1 GNAT superfamily N-acetyltransferase [Leifsonia shinshuensis]